MWSFDRTEEVVMRSHSRTPPPPLRRIVVAACALLVAFPLLAATPSPAADDRSVGVLDTLVGNVTSLLKSVLGADDEPRQGTTPDPGERKITGAVGPTIDPTGNKGSEPERRPEP
jgi:hypothetical protein